MAGFLVATALLVTRHSSSTVAACRALSHSLGDVVASVISAYFVASLIALLVVQFKRR
jgi:hypothetical protein